MPSSSLRAVSLIAIVLLGAMAGWHPRPAVALGQGGDDPAFERLATQPLTLPDDLEELAISEAGDLDLIWAASTLPSLPDDAEPIAFDPGFLYAPDGMLLVSGDDATRFVRVRSGEALGVDGSEALAPFSSDGEPTNFVAIELLAAEQAPDEADGFSVQPGDYELTLWHADLPANADEPLTLGEASDADANPTLIVVVTGAVEVDGDDPETVEAGDRGMTVDGPITLSNGGDSDTTVLAVTISPVEAEESSRPSQWAGRQPPATTGNGGPAAPGTDSSSAVESPSPSVDPSPSPSPADATDTDLDLLSDADEAALGTDPTNPDTDVDALSDGDEVRRGTDPNNPDTDDDALDDGEEILEQRTDPLVSDTDGDGYDDGYEISRTASDPLVFDTDADGDGLLSTAEFRFGTDPTNPDTDGDCLSDSTETGTGVLDPTLRDTDGDGVDDYAVYTGGQTCAPPA